MAVSMYDARVRSGDRDPLVQDATPGCVFRLSPRFTGDLNAGVRAIVEASASISNGRRATQRIPPVWVQDVADAFVVYLSVGVSPDASRLTIGPNAADPADGLAVNAAALTAAAVSNWGIVVFDGLGAAAYLTLSDWQAARPQSNNRNWAQGIVFTGATGLDASGRIEGWTAVIVDRSNPNVDWPRLEFVSLRAGAGFNIGNDRMLRGLTAGALHLVLHSGSPPTAANRLTGGGYVDAAITGPAGWQLVTDGGERILQNAAEISFGTATNVWTRASHIALWTGAAATGDLLWYESILNFTARVGAEPKIPVRAGRIAVPNLR